MIIFDVMGHMVSTESEDELHKFAQAMGLKRSWYQDQNKNPHYDLTTLRAKRRVERAGAKYVNTISLSKNTQSNGDIIGTAVSMLFLWRHRKPAKVKILSPMEISLELYQCLKARHKAQWHNVRILSPMEISLERQSGKDPSKHDLL